MKNLGISTKLFKEDRDKLRIVAETFGLTYPQFIQGIYWAIVRYFDAYSPITKDMLEKIKVFLPCIAFIGRGKAYRSVLYKEKRINKAIFFMQETGKQLLQPIIVSMNGRVLQESYNIDTITKCVLQVTSPNVLQILDEKKKEIGHFGIYDTLLTFIAHKDINMQNKASVISRISMATEAKSRTYIVSSKITANGKLKLQTISREFKFSFYKLLQSLLLAMIRYYTTDMAVSDEYLIMIEAFNNAIELASKSFNPIGTNKRHRDITIAKCLLFLQEEEGIEHIVEIENKNGELREETDTDKILWNFLGTIIPEFKKKISKEDALKNISKDLCKVFIQPAKDYIKEEVESMFMDIRIPTGQKINDGIYYKRKKNNGGLEAYTTYGVQKNHNVFLA